jgi:transcriptional regulator with XRE-family HTH domain
MTSLRAVLAFNLKKRRRFLGISQEKLAEKVATSPHYISQIEQQNKFPSPDMLERIAAALEVDSPQLFSMDSYTDEAVKRFQNAVILDIEKSIAQTINAHISELKISKPKKLAAKQKP